MTAISDPRTAQSSGAGELAHDVSERDPMACSCVRLTPAAASAGFAPERLDAVCRSCIVMLGVAVVFAPAH
jgi:hypothetical protein